MAPAEVLFAREMSLLLYNREEWAPFYKIVVMVFRAIFAQIIYRPVAGRGLFRVWHREAGYRWNSLLGYKFDHLFPKTVSRATTGCHLKARIPAPNPFSPFFTFMKSLLFEKKKQTENQSPGHTPLLCGATSILRAEAKPRAEP